MQWETDHHEEYFDLCVAFVAFVAFDGVNLFPAKVVPHELVLRVDFLQQILIDAECHRVDRHVDRHHVGHHHVEDCWRTYFSFLAIAGAAALTAVAGTATIEKIGLCVIAVHAAACCSVHLVLFVWLLLRRILCLFHAVLVEGVVVLTFEDLMNYDDDCGGDERIDSCSFGYHRIFQDCWGAES